MYVKERVDYEEETFSWTDLFIKIIIALIIILLVVWIVSLSNRKVTTANVVGNTFSENIYKMKDAAEEYFVDSRLPKSTGSVEKVKLQKLYDENILSTLIDEKGKACSAKDSYASVQKLTSDYQMKVYLKCSTKRDYLLVRMNRYDYCRFDICEKVEGSDVVNPEMEYQYSKTTAGKVFGDWSKFSEWSKTWIAKSDTVDVETKVVKENYTYDNSKTTDKYMGNATCGTINGYRLVSSQNGMCSYTKVNTSTVDPICPSYADGYSYVGRNGFTCTYSANTNSWGDPICPTVPDYTYTGRNGFTCNYSKTTRDIKALICPTVPGYTYTGKTALTCNYSKKVVSTSEYTLSYYGSGSGSSVPRDTSTYHYVAKSADYVYKCDGSCGMRWYYTYNIYKKVYKTVTDKISKPGRCPDGYDTYGINCAKKVTTNITKTGKCPEGYDKSGNSCYRTSSVKITKSAECPSSEYSKSGTKCVKKVVSNITQKASCPAGQTISNNKCYKKVTSTSKSTGTKNVTYYRYRTRGHVNGQVDYKWSSSKEDQELLKDGYKLTGETRNKE